MSEEADLDCRGMACPEPVMRTRKMIEGACGPFTVLVDNETARDNVRRFAASADCAVEVAGREDGFLLTVTPPPGAERPVPAEAPAEKASPAGRKRVVFFIKSDVLGEGERELGMRLMRMFLYAAAESPEPPAGLAFANRGVRLVTLDAEAAGHVGRLESAGAEVLVCGTCLDYYDLKGSLKAGRVSNMYEILSLVVGADVLVSL